MELDEGPGDDEPIPPLLPPDDRLWRHPSELASQWGPTPRAGRRRAEGRVLAIATLSGVIGALLATGVLAVTGGMRTRTDTVRTVVQREASPIAVPVAAGAGIVEVAEKAKPAVVEVHVDDNEQQDGSGVVFRSDGHILTSARVVGDARSVRVVLADGDALEATAVGRDRDTDLAVLKVDRTGMDAAALGSVAGLKVGQVAIVVGSSLALGVVSALGREVAVPGGPLLLDMIQTDAPVAATSSGGALVDAAGGVIGITTAVDGVGYATPIDLAREVADQLVATGAVAHAWLGVEGDDLESGDANRLGVDGGAVVRRVRDSSPAAAAGLQPRDVIVAVDGATVQSMSALKVAVRGRRPGQAVDLRFLRDGKEQRVVATLAPRPAV